MSACPTLNFEQGVLALREGQVVAYPTEGVWGLGCRPDQPDAIRRLLDAKHRSPDQGLILIAARCADLAPYIQPLHPDEEALLTHEGPPVTWLVPSAGGAPLLSGAYDTQAVRITQHPLCHRLCMEVGALVSTSANVHGQAPAREVAEIQQQFGTSIDGIVEGALGQASGPSEIRDLKTDAVIRKAEVA